MREFAIIEGFSPDLKFSESIWLEALPARVYHTPQYGKIPMPVERLQNMVKNFKEGVRGQEIATNFDHGEDRAKGSKASGWFRDFDVRPSSDDPKQLSLYAAVEFTEEAQNELKDKAWKYFSLEWDDNWVDNSGNTHKDVVVGGALTNRPLAKKTQSIPVNFSESHWNALTDEEKRDFNIKAIKSKMSKEGATAFSELVEQGIVEVTSESKEWEHSEPGTGPAPRTDEDGSDDPAIKEQWRRDPLPLDPNDPKAPKGDVKVELTEDQIKELISKLELPSDVTTEKFLETVTTSFSEAKALRDAVIVVDEEKKFSEQYPTMYAEHKHMREQTIAGNATAFSESVARITRTEGDKQVQTEQGLSTLAKEQIEETHKKFSEGTATVADFEKVLTTIVNGGLVKFGEVGSSQAPEVDVVDSTATAEGIQNNRKLFAEKVTEIQVEDKELSYREAITKAAQKYPELARAYNATAAA